MLTILSGYPGSGKTTYARSIAGENGVALDLDALAAALCGQAPHAERDPRLMRALNAVFWPLARELINQGIDVIAIRTAPSAQEMLNYGASARRLLLDVPIEVCRARAETRADFDEERFRAACQRADDFRRAYGKRLEIIAPPL